MREKDQLLSDKCTSAENTANKFLEWSDQYHDLVGHEYQTIRKDFNKYATQLKRLSIAAKRPMAVAVFGPSQAGKSYLISALARKGDKALRAKIGNESVDFLKKINPEGGKESTGIVTRFTIRNEESPYPDKPVRTRLLDQYDLIKILGNTFLADVDPGSIPCLEQEDVQQFIKSAEEKVHSNLVDEFSSSDVYDLRDYFLRYFRGVARIQSLKDDFWDSAAEVLPYLDIVDRAEFLSILWGENETFTTLYIRLYNALKTLNFSNEVYTALGSDESKGALLPRRDSVIDVAALNKLGNENTETITVKGQTGISSDLQRCEFAALISELFIQIEEIPYDYFRHTDLLDFPGYRSREQIRDLEYFLGQDNSLESLFLRGKVAYLFQRYREERELTSMLLCVADSNQEVKSLPDVVDEWIRNTHGETPDDRLNKPISLFLVLTKFDKEFDRKGGVGESHEEHSNKWKTRLHSSLWDFFGKQHTWPIEWSTNGKFNNTYWIRNPKYEAPHLFEYDDSGVEIGLISTQREMTRLEDLKRAFISTTKVSAHFRDPEKAWNAALTPNDGGVSYLAEQLGEVCDPDLKYNQIVAQFNILRRDMFSRMSEFYISDDQSELIKKRIDNSKVVVKSLARSVKAERFGALINSLYVAESDLTELFIKLDKEISDDVILVSEGNTEESDILSALGIESEDEGTEEDVRVKSFSEVFASEVVSKWVSKLHDFSDDESARSFYFLPDNVAIELVKELKSGFFRYRIQNKIKSIVNKSTRLRMNVHKAMAYPTRRSANLVNNYINYLGFDLVDANERPHIHEVEIFKEKEFECKPPVLSEKANHYESKYGTDWLMAFLILTEENAKHESGGVINTSANDSLNNLMTTLEH